MSAHMFRWLELVHKAGKEAHISVFFAQVFARCMRKKHSSFSRALSEANSSIYSACMVVLALIILQVTDKVRAGGPCGLSDAASCSSTRGATSEDAPHRIYNRQESVLIQKQINNVFVHLPTMSRYFFHQLE